MTKISKTSNRGGISTNFKSWGYQDFTAGAITSSNISITDNDNGTGYTFDDTKIIGGTAIIRRKSNGELLYTGTTSLFSSKVLVDTQSGVDLTLTGIPNAYWGDVRVRYLYQYNAQVSGLELPSAELQKAVIADLGDALDDYVSADGTTDLTGDWVILTNDITLTNGKLSTNTFNIGGAVTDVDGFSTGSGDNSKLTTKGYVDDIIVGTSSANVVSPLTFKIGNIPIYNNSSNIYAKIVDSGFGINSSGNLTSSNISIATEEIVKDYFDTNLITSSTELSDSANIAYLDQANIFTEIQNYSGNLTFSSANNIINKKYVDDTVGALSTSDIDIEQLGTPTVDKLDEYINYNMCSNLAGDSTTQFTITDAGSGEIDVGAGKGFIRTTDSNTGNIISFDFAGQSGISLTDQQTNWIYLDYNGGTPIANTTTSLSNLDLNTEVIIGRVYRDGNTLHIYQTGQYFSNYRSNDYKKDFEVFGIQRASGLVLGETGTRNVSLTAGVFYCAHNRTTSSAIDTSGADTFDVFNSGDSTSPDSTGVSQVDNTQYWNGSALANLTNNRYGTRFFFLDHEGDLYMLYGTSNATSIAIAENEPIPSLNDFLNEFAIYVGRVVIQEGASTFEVITNPFLTAESGAIVTDHGDLAGLSADDHSQYLLVDGTRDLSGDWTIENNNITLTNGTLTANTIVSTGSGNINGNLDVGGNLVVSGDFTVSGTTTFIDTETLQVEDKNIEMGVVDTPTDTTANGGGITLKGTTDKTIIWDNTNDNWTSSEHFNLASGKSYKINNVDINTGGTLDNVAYLDQANTFTADQKISRASNSNLVIETSGNSGNSNVKLYNTSDSVADSLGYASLRTYLGSSNTEVASIIFNAVGTSEDASEINFWTKESGGSIGRRMTIADDGNIGIGTTTPSSKLQVQNNDLGTDWNPSTDDIAGFVAIDAQVSIISNDSGTYGSALAFKQVDGTVYENAWGILRETNGDGAGDGSLQFTYGTDKFANLNSKMLSISTSGDVTLEGDNNVILRNADDSDNYRSILNWKGIQIGNNGDNYIVAGNTATGGRLNFVVNNTNDLAGDLSDHNGTVAMKIDHEARVGIGLSPSSNMDGLSIEAGLLTLKETTTPTADSNYGKIYTKSDNKLYFQDGAGTEHEIAFV